MGSIILLGFNHLCVKTKVHTKQLRAVTSGKRGKMDWGQRRGELLDPFLHLLELCNEHFGNLQNLCDDAFLG